MAFKQPFLLFYVFVLCLVATCHATNPSFYSIWPLENQNGPSADGSSNEAITAALRKDLNNDASKLYVSESPSLDFTWYWYAELTTDLVTKYQKFPGVRLVKIPNNAALSFRATPTRRDTVEKSSFTTDAAALPQLQIISLPSGTSLTNSKGYVYDSSAGDGINIYVIDTGLTPSNREFSKRKVSWLFAGPFASTEMTDADPHGHGTCMASMAMGNKDGVARRASLTVVRSDIVSDPDLSAEIWIDGLAKVYEDVIKNKAQSKAVVSMSNGVGQNGDQDYLACYTEAMEQLLLALDKEDIPLLAAVGNNGVEIQAYPALFIKPVNGAVPVPNLIVVGGAIVNSGEFWNEIRDPEIMIYGPADDMSEGFDGHPGLECADSTTNGYKQGEYGTSHATASVAGLVAYFMGKGNKGAASRENLFHIAVKRGVNKTGPPMPWNNVDGTAD